MSRDLQAVLRESHPPPNLSIMATRSDLLTRLKCAEARWGPTLVGAIIDHFHGPSLLMGRQALRPYRYRRIPVGGGPRNFLLAWGIDFLGFLGFLEIPPGQVHKYMRID